MQQTQSNLPLFILLLPMLGFILNGVVVPLILRGFAKTNVTTAALCSTIPIVLAFFCAIAAFSQLSEHTLYATPFRWLAVGDLSIDFSLKIDRLSGLLVMIITGIGSLIHIFSAGYMSHEECVGRYFSYLSLFCFSMLLLVLGNELPLLFFGWEGVGLCSYLLIGLWYTETEKANAGKKAFIANRVGDLGFIVGAFILWKLAGTFNFDQLNVAFENWKVGNLALHPKWISFACLALFIGATGKSAQIPLYVWLPDAMSGPTPVSALIHAATMVTAGVYMIARLNGLFEMAPDVLTIIAYVGGFTALFAATIAIAQKDIKKVLAYSTVSQLGFMFLACGVGAYQTAVFHLMTHAFFKALLFLGSGSVIHACSGEQDMTKMGGLKSHLPHTFITMLIGSLALSGIPIFSGFFSKDEILYSAIALESGHAPLFIIGICTAALTAIYTGRMMAMTFLGQPRYDHHVKDHLHESPAIMLAPLYILAFLAAFGGLLGIPHLLGDMLGHIPHMLSHWLAPVVPAKTLPMVAVKLPLHEGVVIVASSLIAIGGFLCGVKLFTSRQTISDVIGPGIKGAQTVLENKYYIDELYQTVFLGPIKKVSDFSYQVVDRLGIDGLVNGVGGVVSKASQNLRLLQNGDVQSYALWMLVGFGLCVVAAIAWLQPEAVAFLGN